MKNTTKGQNRPGCKIDLFVCDFTLTVPRRHHGDCSRSGFNNYACPFCGPFCVVCFQYSGCGTANIFCCISICCRSVW